MEKIVFFLQVADDS